MFPLAELPFSQHLSRNPGFFVHEGGGSQVVEESLHVPASLRIILFNQRDLKGDSKFIEAELPSENNPVHDGGEGLCLSVNPQAAATFNVLTR